MGYSGSPIHRGQQLALEKRRVFGSRHGAEDHGAQEEHEQESGQEMVR
jgi:hypothetical protein